ncbi:MAG TPA: hypothetical protein VF708_00700 [Pyrinomonadaceae bacterium]|jgi:hypothetical protein
MSDESALIGDSSTHGGSEPAPEGGFYRHRLTIRFNNGETFVYTVREALHAEDIAAEHRFAVIHSYKYDSPDQCDEIVLLNLNNIAYIKTEHVTEGELQREEASRREHEQKHQETGTPRHLSRIGFI